MREGGKEDWRACSGASRASWMHRVEGLGFRFGVQGLGFRVEGLPGWNMTPRWVFFSGLVYFPEDVGNEFALVNGPLLRHIVMVIDAEAGWCRSDARKSHDVPGVGFRVSD